MRLLCAGCMGRVILGTDCAAARKYFGHVPARFADHDWPEPEPLRDADRRPLPLGLGFEEEPVVLRTDLSVLVWDFLPLGAPESIRSGGVLQAFSGAELVEVATGLIIAVFAMLGMEHDWAADRDDRSSR